ncbi:NAD-dependent epimerase/dehydratase family protein [Acidithiobacillus sp. AC3]
MKPVLVTGATGFIGGHLAQRLLGEGLPVRLLVRDPQRLSAELQQGAQIYVGDLTQPDSLPAAVRGVGLVFHCAANVHTWDRRESYWQVNVHGLGHLLDAIAQTTELPERFVHFSSVDVYGFPKEPAVESSVLQSTGFGYGDSKQAAEALLCRRATEMNLPWTILRPTNVMGPGSPFIERIGREIRNGLMLKVDGGQVDCGYLDVQNLVDVAHWAARNPTTQGETYNVRDPISVSWRQFLQDLRQSLRGHGLLLNLPHALAMPAAQVMAAPYGWLHLRAEPLLHPLLVQIFGRTCGHSIEKLQAAGAPLGRIPYAQSLRVALGLETPPAT